MAGRAKRTFYSYKHKKLKCSKSLTGLLVAGEDSTEGKLNPDKDDGVLGVLRELSPDGDAAVCTMPCICVCCGAVAPACACPPRRRMPRLAGWAAAASSRRASLLATVLLALVCSSHCVSEK